MGRIYMGGGGGGLMGRIYMGGGLMGRIYSWGCGPCPKCREWMLRNSISRHQKKCLSDNVTRFSKKNLLIQSDVMAGRLQSSTSKLLRDEVFTIMTPDSVSAVAQNDTLISMLGESWLRRNLDNKLKRKYYSSQRMRLNARLLMILRKQEMK